MIRERSTFLTHTIGLCRALHPNIVDTIIERIEKKSTNRRRNCQTPKPDCRQSAEKEPCSFINRTAPGLACRRRFTRMRVLDCRRTTRSDATNQDRPSEFAEPAIASTAPVNPCAPPIAITGPMRRTLFTSLCLVFCLASPGFALEKTIYGLNEYALLADSISTSPPNSTPEPKPPRSARRTFSVSAMKEKPGCVSVWPSASTTAH